MMSKKFVPPRLAPVPKIKPVQPVANEPQYRCAYCGCGLTAAKKTRDHVIPTARGGSDHKSNIVIACGRCNQLKADLLFDSFEDAQAYLLALHKIQKVLKGLRAKYVRKPQKSGADLLKQLIRQVKDD
jgi:hypothetical protein